MGLKTEDRFARATLPPDPPGAELPQVEEDRRPPGRPRKDTVALNLRLPRDHMRALVKMAKEKSDDRVHTAQSVILDLIEQAIARG